MKLQEGRELVFAKKPEFAKLYKDYRDKSWIDYSRENYPGGDSIASLACRQAGLQNDNVVIPAKAEGPLQGAGIQNHKPRMTELLSVFEKVLSPLLNKKKVAHAVQALKQTGFVSTADHHGVLCHPFFSNSALLSNQIHLSCGGVSISTSSYPRGIFFHDSNLKQVRIPFISLHTKHLPVYGHPSMKKATVIREIKKISHYNIQKTQKRVLKSFLTQILDTDQIWEKSLYSEQLTIINDLFWETLFGNSRGNLVYLDVESLVRQLLLDTETGRHIFDETYRNLYINNYEGIIGAHDTKRRKGSHLFWYIDREKRIRKQFWIKKGYLETDDRQVRIKLEQKSIRESLLDYSIMPTMALCYSILAFHYGLTLGGGFSQIQYLGEMGIAYEEVFGGWGDWGRTDIFSGEFVAIGLANEKTSVPASLLDILLWGGKEKSEKITAQFEKITVGESLDLMMPDLIHMLTGKRLVLSDLKKPPKTFYVTK
ncbi:hypothetical protein A3D80_03100 [Candidatus Roizmanbacteria bacterium RIFCSPHIGHO2_02_FULL_40_13b]|uniref:Uncharacterized protein n=1 Tax=Candidatus Roizmanbacteria bacterium RIFCSPHIGHO2_01_FULL_39_24 TaxID=1802032 RepID=A0A1F7GIV3_9BACT|nr:MAG: hypothetical protein A2799_02230 [Candidatus Roizmanbacteria bacterium RIFCSPHIGHO2_01_FULL_39_24]OGK26957.1 MAG: hypothetical protein A3D80_03100 [Candidatus Roizmanbacteria bacterium RIFCSPHIGHO2_02_FULL_40_13b]OGK48887.1 MAG: hypothetical protein A3A56_01625 [Candidatus Roizmanbacteria bacterium RIFCSPLOWO2_01_FULL_40_32]